MLEGLARRGGGRTLSKDEENCKEEYDLYDDLLRDSKKTPAILRHDIQEDTKLLIQEGTNNSIDYYFDSTISMKDSSSEKRKSEVAEITKLVDSDRQSIERDDSFKKKNPGFFHAITSFNFFKFSKYYKHLLQIFSLWVMLFIIFDLFYIISRRHKKVPNSVRNNLADVNDDRKATDTLVFWHVPRSAGTTIKAIASKCIGLVVAADLGRHKVINSLKIVDSLHPKGKFVNVDVSTMSGLKKAKDLGLAQSGLAQLIFTSQFQAVSDLFDIKHKGRMFTIIRDPITRTLSMYQSLSSRKSFQMSFADFLQSSLVTDNWMTRQLTGNQKDQLTLKDLEMAQEILEAKFIIGLSSDVSSSFRKFQKLYDWKLDDDSEKCVKNLLNSQWAEKNVQLQVTSGRKEMELIKAINEYDLQLYSYAKILYINQGKEFDFT